MKNLLFICFAVIITSCSDFLDVKPKSQSLPDNLEVLQHLIQNDGNIQTEKLTLYMNDDYKLIPGATTGYNAKQTDRVYDFADYYTDPEENDGQFDHSWTIIDRANLILNNIDAAVGDDEELRNRIKGQALIMRAGSYFTLANVWCPPYTSATANDPETGMPLRTEHILTGDLTRTTLNELYEFILKDIEEAIPLLPEIDLTRADGSVQMAHSLLTRVYFMMGDYENALVEAKKTMTYEINSLADYNNIDSYELDATKNPENVFLRTNVFFNAAYVSQSTFYVNPSLVSLFDTSNDLRYSKLITLDWSGNTLYIGSNGYFSGISVPDIMLMQAECEARVGDYNIATDLVNTIRSKRFAIATSGQSPTYYELTATNKEQAIAHVLMERRLELCFTFSRFLDIRRLNALHNAGISLERPNTIGDASALPANDNKWTLAIPQINISINPEVKQNPR